jgi:pimeloyl-ACP methyl ester carboxylesterase
LSHFVFVHGAWCGPWLWNSTIAELRKRGHSAVAVELPCDDVEAGAIEYARVIVDAIDEADFEADVRVVGHSLAGLVLPLLPAMRKVDRLIYLCGITPRPGERISDLIAGGLTKGGESDIGRRYDRLARSFWSDEQIFGELMMGDATAAERHESFRRLRRQARRPLREESPVRTLATGDVQYALFADDQIFHELWLRNEAARLGVEAEKLPGSHFAFVHDPEPLVEMLLV